MFVLWIHKFWNCFLYTCILINIFFMLMSFPFLMYDKKGERYLSYLVVLVFYIHFHAYMQYHDSLFLLIAYCIWRKDDWKDGRLYMHIILNWYHLYICIYVTCDRGKTAHKKCMFWNQDLKCMCIGFLDTFVIA